jgi:hypothetical protein
VLLEPPTARIRCFGPLISPNMNQLVDCYRLGLVVGCTLLLSACGNNQSSPATENPANSSISSGDSGTGGATGALADSTATVGATAGSTDANTTPASTPENTGNASGNTNASDVGAATNTTGASSTTGH